MIKQSLLDKLEGKLVEEAEEMVRKAGHKPYLVPEECRAITMQARPNTVILWQKHGKIDCAKAGDGLEIESDV